MKFVKSAKSFVMVLVVGACASSTEPTVSPLVGDWLGPRESVGPAGSTVTNLSLGKNGSFSYRITDYGLYGQNPGAVSAYINLSGTYRVDGEHLILSATRQAVWDSFYGSSSRETVTQINSTLFEQARFDVSAFRLTLEYITYPADAPVLTTQSFTRLGLD